MDLPTLCAQYLRKPVTVTIDIDTGTPVLTFQPPLTVQEQATFADLQVMAKISGEMTLAEWQAIKAEALKTYLGVASPTLVQTAAATKAIIRVLGVIVRS
jgi:hypothetical protein